MQKIKTILAVSALSLTATAGTSFAAVDVYDWTDAAVAITGTSGVSNDNFMITPGSGPFDSPFYRDFNEDWGWQHDAIAGASTATSIELNISNFDVDNPCFAGGPADGCEDDRIYGYDTATAMWLEIGSLTGINDAYSFTEFSLDSALFDDVEAGLQVWMDIDFGLDGWVVTLAKSVITTEGEDPGDPNPDAIPLPAAGWLMLASLGGLAAMRRRRKA